jgi:hypothetical protein
MNRFGSFLTWFTALLLAGFVAGCGGDDDDAAPAPSAAGKVCSTTGTEPCVNLATAGEFAILAVSAITDVAPSAITGNVGLNAGASITGLTCAEVTNGKIFDGDNGYDGEGGPTTCLTTDSAKLSQALIDIGAAFLDAESRASSGAPPGSTIPPGVYDLASITIDTDVTLDGPASGVWIIQTPGSLSLTTGNVVLTGGALPQNVFWRVGGDVSVGAGRTLPGVVMADGTIAVGAGSSVNGRLYSASDVTLDTSTVARP